jgi:hypothetical protein
MLIVYATSVYSFLRREEAFFHHLRLAEAQYANDLRGVEKVLTKDQRARLKKELHIADEPRGVFFFEPNPVPQPVIKRGATATVALQVRRSRDFTGEITLTFPDLPAGLKVNPARPVIKIGDPDKVELKVTAGGNLPAGAYTLEVRATSTRGEATGLQVDVKVEP